MSKKVDDCVKKEIRKQIKNAEVRGERRGKMKVINEIVKSQMKKYNISLFEAMEMLEISDDVKQEYLTYLHI